MLDAVTGVRTGFYDMDKMTAGLQKGDEVIGSETRVKIVKNKVAPPFTEAEFDIMYNEGISNVGSLLDLAMDFDILQKRGSWISYKGTQLAQGRDAAEDIHAQLSARA